MEEGPKARDATLWKFWIFQSFIAQCVRNGSIVPSRMKSPLPSISSPHAQTRALLAHIDHRRRAGGSPVRRPGHFPSLWRTENQTLKSFGSFFSATGISASSLRPASPPTMAMDSSRSLLGLCLACSVLSAAMAFSGMTTGPLASRLGSRRSVSSSGHAPRKGIYLPNSLSASGANSRRGRATLGASTATMQAVGGECWRFFASITLVHLDPGPSHSLRHKLS